MMRLKRLTILMLILVAGTEIVFGQSQTDSIEYNKDADSIFETYNIKRVGCWCRPELCDKKIIRHIATYFEPYIVDSISGIGIYEFKCQYFSRNPESGPSPVLIAGEEIIFYSTLDQAKLDVEEFIRRYGCVFSEADRIRIRDRFIEGQIRNLGIDRDR